MNENRTCSDFDTPLTQPRSRPVRRPARLRLIDKDGGRHGTYKDSTEAYKQAEEMKLGDPNTSDDDVPNGWYLESTKFKASKHKRRQVAGAKP